MTGHKARAVAGRILLYVTLIILCAIMMVPFLYTISTSFKENIYVFELPPEFIPKAPTIQNYIDAWQSNNFQLYFLNSVKVATATMLFAVFVASTQAYAFARMQFPAKNFLFSLYLFTMMVPDMLKLIPQFVLARNLHLLNKLSGLVIVYVAGGIPFQTFLIRGFFEAIPRELEEAAFIDGASRFTVFTRIAMPLVKPALGTLAIFSFLGAWDEFTWALTAINDVSKRTLPIALRLFQGQHASQWGLVFAASLIAVGPVILVFVAFQRYFVRGLTTGALKY